MSCQVAFSKPDAPARHSSRVALAGGKLAEAEDLMGQTLRLLRKNNGDWHWAVGRALLDLASICRLRGNHEEAEGLEAEAQEIFRVSPPWRTLLNADCFEAIAGHMLCVGAYEPAVDALQWAVAMRAKLCPDHPSHRAAQALLQSALEQRDANGAGTTSRP